MLSQGFLGKPIKLARLSITFNRRIELAGVASFKPRAKSRQLATVPHPKRDLHPKTVRSIHRQAGLKEPR